MSRLLLEHGNPLFGVEPNTEMREAGAALLADCPRFTSVAASAEATTLAAASIDLIVAGQAFHPKNRSWGLETLAALRQAQGERLAESLTHRVTTRNSVRAEPVEA